MKKNFDLVRETMLTCTLPNGLRIDYIPKEGFSKTFAMLAANFGSVDADFTMEDGSHIITPAGVAHFLEHKMFEDEDGNALQKFAATGAMPNAFTSHNMTAYHFSCTDSFEKNLEILLKFVFTPYFTDENVEKEKGIIGQEIGMMDDQPFWQTYIGMYQALYHEHPVRISIAGSVDSIAGITPELLYQCHRAFYSPANMALVVCGQADFDTIVSMAQKFSPEKAAHIAARGYGTRRSTVCRSEVVRRMAVSRPYFIAAFKDDRVQEGQSSLQRQLVGELCCRILAGETSALYTEMYRDGWIDRQFHNGYSLHPQAACAYFIGNSHHARQVRERLVDRVRALARDVVDAAVFDRAWRAAYGMTLRTLDQPDELCRAQCEAAFGGEDFLDFARLQAAITREQVQERFAVWAQPDRSVLSLVEPLSGAEKG